jgi:hypothetical protein
MPMQCHGSIDGEMVCVASAYGSTCLQTSDGILSGAGFTD